MHPNNGQKFLAQKVRLVITVYRCRYHENGEETVRMHNLPVESVVKINNTRLRAARRIIQERATFHECGTRTRLCMQTPKECMDSEQFSQEEVTRVHGRCNGFLFSHQVFGFQIWLNVSE